MLTYAIGDIHGRYDLLLRALDEIGHHAGGGVARIVFLGDYIDRGLWSRDVVKVLMELDRLPNITCLKGNHEQMLIDAVRGRDTGDVTSWLISGGAETIKSYGGAGAGAISDLDLIPEDHVQWMEALPTLLSDQRHIFVHAGLKPRVKAERQDDAVRLWIREKFLRAKNLQAFPDGKHIVHGHTPHWEGKPDASLPELLSHRTNLDTGAFFTNVLAVGVFDPERSGGPLQVLKIALD